MRACALVLVAIAAPAEAGVVVGADVPFSADELERALAARAPGQPAPVLDVRALAPGRLEVVGTGRRWQIEVGPARGTRAARLVALSVVDDAGAVTAPVATGPTRPRLTVHAGLAGGLGAGDLRSAVLGLEVSAGARWWLAVGGHWREELRVEPTAATSVDGRGWAARALVGRRLGRLELGAGPSLGRMTIDSGRHARGWFPGVAAVARAGWPLAPRLALVVGGDVELRQHRIEVRHDDRLVAATPWAALAVTVGVRWEPGR